MCSPNTAPAIIDKGIPGNGLLAHLITSKYIDHLPLYRQEAIFARHGIELSDSTLGSWIGEVGVWLAPLSQRLHEKLLLCTALHADETPITILGGTKNIARMTGYVWAYASMADAQDRIVVYECQKGRINGCTTC